MRGAFYVTTALLVAASSRSAAESDQAEILQSSERDSVALGGMVIEGVPDTFLRTGYDQHDELTLSTDEEERAPTVETANFIESVKTTLLKATGESMGDTSAVLKATQEAAPNWHPSAHPGSSVSIDAASARIRDNSLNGKATLELSGEVSRKRQQPAHPGADETVPMSKRLAHPGSGAAINAPTHTRPTNEQVSQPINPWEHKIRRIQEFLRLAEQYPNLLQEKVGPTLRLHAVDHQSGQTSHDMGTAQLYKGRSQSKSFIEFADIPTIIWVRDKLIESRNVPCLLSMEETRNLLAIYSWGRQYSSQNKMVSQKLGDMLSQMSTIDLLTVLRHDALKAGGSNSWMVFEDYRLMVQKICIYLLDLSLDKGNQAVLEDKYFWTMLHNAYHEKLKVMYQILHDFCGHNPAHCNIMKKPSLPNTN